MNRPAIWSEGAASVQGYGAPIRGAGWCRALVGLRAGGLPRNRALLGDPGAEVDQPAALAAEGAEGRVDQSSSRPQVGHLTYGGPSLRWPLQRSGAAAQREGHVVRRLHGACASRSSCRKRRLQRWWLPLISGIEPGIRRQRDAQQLQRRVALEGDLEDAALGDSCAAAAVLAREPQQLGDRVAQRAQQPEPLAEGCACASSPAAIEPEVVIGQVELAGAARDRAAVLDRVQEFRVAQRLQEVGAGVHSSARRRTRLAIIGAGARRPRPGGSGIRSAAPRWRSSSLSTSRAHVAAGRDREDVEQARHGGAAAPRARHLVVVERLAVQEVEPQEGAHPLVQRLLEHERVGSRTRGGWPDGCGLGHRAIVLERVAAVNHRALDRRRCCRAQVSARGCARVEIRACSAATWSARRSCPPRS